MKKLNFLGLALLVLVLFFAACDSSGGGGSDTWTAVSSMSQINGTWTGTFSDSGTFKKFVEAQGDTWGSSMQDTFGDMNLKSNVDLNFTINAGVLISGIRISAYTFSDGKINDSWEAVKSLFTKSNLTVNDSNHSLTYNTNIESNFINESNVIYIQINQNGNKIKYQTTTIFGNYLDIIFNKQ